MTGVLPLDEPGLSLHVPLLAQDLHAVLVAAGLVQRLLASPCRLRRRALGLLLPLPPPLPHHHLVSLPRRAGPLAVLVDHPDRHAPHRREFVAPRRRPLRQRP